jgi:hypothetical protein
MLLILLFFLAMACAVGLAFSIAGRPTASPALPSRPVVRVPHSAASYLDLVEPIKQAKRSGNLSLAEQLCWKAIASAETESELERIGVPPWYYEQLAIVLRKQGRIAEEVAILERYARQRHAPGTGPSRLQERLLRARELAVPRQRRHRP